MNGRPPHPRNNRSSSNGGPCALTDLNELTFQLNNSFFGRVSPFAQDHLVLPDSEPEPVPEPAMLSLLGIGVAALMTRRFRRNS